MGLNLEVPEKNMDTQPATQWASRYATVSRNRNERAANAAPAQQGFHRRLCPRATSGHFAREARTPPCSRSITPPCRGPAITAPPIVATNCCC